MDPRGERKLAQAASVLLCALELQQALDNLMASRLDETAEVGVCLAEGDEGGRVEEADAEALQLDGQGEDVKGRLSHCQLNMRITIYKGLI